MKPTLGRVVHVMGFEDGSDDVAAIITKVCSNKDHDPAIHGGFAIVNLTIFPDGDIGTFGKRVPMFENRFKAEQYLSEGNSSTLVCFWPDRV